MSDQRTDAHYEVRPNQETGEVCFTRVNRDGTRSMEWVDGFWKAMKHSWSLMREGYRVEAVE